MTNRYHILTALLLTLVVSFSSCHKPEQEEITVAIKYTEVGGERGTQWVQVLTMSDSQQWTLSLTDEDGNQVTWATVDPPTGTGTQYSVTVTWDVNETSGPRTLVIHGVSAGQESNVSLVQNATSPSGGGGGVFPDKITPDKVYGWMELPATNDPNLYFISHESTTSKAYRNFSYYWDVNNMVALWVAYPLNKASIGSGSRTNYWDLDPKLPVSAQPLLTSGYKSTGSSGESDGGTQFYQRGHQCPSADRLAYADNIQLREYASMLNSRDIDFNVVHENDLTGSFTAEEGQRVLFTIPWDEGWTCFIDGQKVPIDKTWNLFMSVEAHTGHHTYEMKFFPAWMNYGLILCGTALLGLVILMVVWKKRKPADNVIPQLTEEKPAEAEVLMTEGAV